MPDISMCSNNTCPKRGTCYRFLAIPFEQWQCYGEFAPNENGECKVYWQIPAGMKVNKILMNELNELNKNNL